MATIIARKRKKGMRYTAQIRITLSNGSIHTESQTFDKKTHAKFWAKKREVEFNNPEFLHKVAMSGITIGKVLQLYIDNFSTNNPEQPFGRSKLAHIKQLMNFPIAELDAIQITPKQIVDHIIERRKSGVVASTVNNDLIWLKNSFRAIKIINNDMPLNLKAIKEASELCRIHKYVGKSEERNRRPTIEELNTILSHYQSVSSRMQLPMVDIILFALFSARRQDEITRMQWKDLDKRTSTILIRKMKHPRKKTDTTVLLTPEALALIMKQPHVNGEQRIFPYVAKSISTSFTRACQKLGIEDLHFHDLRHETASWLFEMGSNINQVSNVTGHLSWTSLKRYTHIHNFDKYDKYSNWKWRPVEESMTDSPVDKP